MSVHVERELGSPGVHWLFPRAPQRPVTILGGRPAHAWYDVLAYDRSRIDDAGIEEATDAVARAVHAERDRDPHRRVVLVGFSQGGVLALHAGLRLADEVEGIVALAAALPFPDRVPPAPEGSPRVFFGHGRFDRCVPYALGRESYLALTARGYRTEWHAYWCGHVVAPRVLRDLRGWLGLDRRSGRRPLVQTERPSRDGLEAA